MKKLCFIVVGIALLTAFYACQKEQLGVYNPKMRIEKIYNETDSHYLLEQWVWNESTLSKIDRFRSSGNILYTDNYVYDEQNRLARIERDNQYTEFLYEGKLLTTINTYSNKKLVETYHLTYEKDKLAHISIEKPAKGAGNVDLFSLFLPGNADVMESVFPTKDSKIETYNYSSVKMDFQWDGDNVRYLEMEIVRPDSTGIFHLFVRLLQGLSHEGLCHVPELGNGNGRQHADLHVCVCVLRLDVKADVQQGMSLHTVCAIFFSFESASWCPRRLQRI